MTGTMTCQRCKKKFTLQRPEDSKSFAEMLDAHLEAHRLEDRWERLVVR